jgi:hypothetical protein
MTKIDLFLIEIQGFYYRTQQLTKTNHFLCDSDCTSSKGCIINATIRNAGARYKLSGKKRFTKIEHFLIEIQVFHHTHNNNQPKKLKYFVMPFPRKN